MPETPNENRKGNQRALIGAGVAAATLGAAFVWGRKVRQSEDSEPISDAPPHVLRGPARDEVEGDGSLVGRTVMIGKPRQEIYEAWRDFTRFPSFMDNVKTVEDLGGGRSRWTIAGPAGKDVELVTSMVEDDPGRRIAWESEPESDIDTSGILELTDAPSGRGTYVRLLMSYDPPASAFGRGIAKLLQREPTLQARRDLRRFKQLMETGEVTTNASPSARKSESPTEARV